MDILYEYQDQTKMVKQKFQWTKPYFIGNPNILLML